MLGIPKATTLALMVVALGLVFAQSASAHEIKNIETRCALIALKKARETEPQKKGTPVGPNADEVYTMEVALDLQRWMLLEGKTVSGTHWFWVERRGQPERWDDMRRAVYSRARPQAGSAAAP